MSCVMYHMSCAHVTILCSFLWTLSSLNTTDKANCPLLDIKQRPDSHTPASQPVMHILWTFLWSLVGFHTLFHLQLSIQFSSDTHLLVSTLYLCNQGLWCKGFSSARSHRSIRTFKISIPALLCKSHLEKIATNEESHLQWIGSLGQLGLRVALSVSAMERKYK